MESLRFRRFCIVAPAFLLPLSLFPAQVAKPDDAPAFHKAEPDLDTGVALLADNRPSEALPHLRRAVAAAIGDSRAHRELGKAYLMLNQLEPAQAELEIAAEIAPGDGVIHDLLAQVYGKRGLTEKARAEGQRYMALTTAKSAPETPVDEARELLNRGKLIAAEQAIRVYLASHQDSADAHYLLGSILFRQQRPRESLAEFTAGAKFRKPSSYELDMVGRDYVLLEDYGNADKWFTKSLEWNPGNLQTLYYLGRAKYNENRFEEAAAIFEECLKRDPNNVRAKDNLGLSYEGLGRMDEAIAAYRQAIAWQVQSPSKNPGPLINLGAALTQNNHADEAVPYLLEAVGLAPADVKAHRELGKAYLRLDRLKEAQAQLEMVVELAPQNAPGHFMLGQVYRKQGNAAKAKAEFDRYAALNGTHSTPETPER